MADSMARIAAELSAWVRLPGQACRNFNNIGGLRAETFGTFSHPRCHLKGGDTNIFLEFLVTIQLPRYGGALRE
eukprot:3638995-Lingulodinium_polyedra.AAC.1